MTTIMEKRCASCGEPVITEVATEEIVYGPEREVLIVSVPRHSCSACGFVFTDCEAEDIRAEAINLHITAKNARNG